MKRHKPNLLIKPLIGLGVFFFVLLFFAGFLGLAAKKFDFFRVKAVIIRQNNEANGRIAQGPSLNQDSRIEFPYLLGKNIFAVDLRKEEESILKIYPEYRLIRLVRVLPDRLFIDFLRRRPVAYLKLSRYFCIDENAVIFNMPAGIEPADSSGRPQDQVFPVILGLDKKISGPKPGARYNYKELISALHIIKAMKSNIALRELRVKSIDLADRSNISFLIEVPSGIQNYVKNGRPAGPDNLEIKIGDNYVNDKINILGSLFVQEKKDWSNIKYIDLRFKDPVIKLKEQNK